MNLDPIRAAIEPYLLLIKLALVVVLAASMFIGGCSHGAAKWEGKYGAEVAAHKAAKVAHAAVLRDLADKTKAAEAAVKAASDKAKADRKTADKKFKDATHEADQAKRALRNHLRAGTVRLRDEWACPAARPAEGDAADLAPGQDAAADLRHAGAVDLVAAGDHADNWIVWLQSELTSTRTACGVTP